MLNQIVLVGKVVELPTLRETSGGSKVANLLLEVDRNFKNAQGEYEKDLILCTLWRGVAESAISMCEVGSLVGVKGRVQANMIMTKENKPFYSCEVVAEKVSFLQASS
ncbi:MAG: single-stranded DNA-binding protein [Erysipelotrichia bacterium]|jgi:single-strand DNA-binding protein|nr:single-stranded DNA-binding protein [Erysipelotrichia bacterium]